MRTALIGAVAACGLLVSACSSADPTEESGSAPEPAASEEAPAATTDDVVRRIFGDNLRDQLRADLGLDEAEADCVVDEVLSGWESFESLASQPEVMAAELIDRSEAAQEVCFSESRQASLAEEIAAGASEEQDPSTSETAFLTAVRTVEGVSGEDADLVAAGRSVCDLAEGLGSLTSLTAALTVDEVASVTLADELEPRVGGRLDADQLTAFSIISVVSFCEELNDL